MSIEITSETGHGSCRTTNLVDTETGRTFKVLMRPVKRNDGVLAFYEIEVMVSEPCSTRFVKVLHRSASNERACHALFNGTIGRIQHYGTWEAKNA